MAIETGPQPSPPPTCAEAFERDLLPLLADGCHRLHKAWHGLRHITVELTRRCNLRCRHCYASAGPEKGAGELDFRELCVLGWQIRRDLGTRVPISLTGGEPLLRADLRPLLRFYRLLGLNVSLSTNGTLLTTDHMPELAECLQGMRAATDAQGNVRDKRLLDIWQRGFATCRQASWRHCGHHRHGD